MITKQELVKRVGELLKELTENYKQLSNSETPNELEYELFEINAIYFAENAKILRKLESLERTNLTDEEEAKNETVSVPSIDEEANDESIVKNEDEEIIENLDTPQHEEEVEEDHKEEYSSPEDTEVEPISSEGIKDTLFTPETINYEQEKKQEENKQGSRHEQSAPDHEKNRDEDANSDDTSSPRTRNEMMKEDQLVTNEVVQKEKEFSFRPDDQEQTRDEQSSDEQAPSTAEEKHKIMSLNDRISAQRKTIASNYNQHPESLQRIRDIKSAISLNDKLLFIKDLFNGYSLAYSEAIELLNRFGNFADADEFLKNNYAVKNNWESKKETVSKLYVILRKRYG